MITHNNSNIFSKLTGCLRNLLPITRPINNNNISVDDNRLNQVSQKSLTTRNGGASKTLGQVREKKDKNYHIDTTRKKASKRPKIQSIHEEAEHEHAAIILQKFAKICNIKTQSDRKLKAIKENSIKINSLLSVPFEQRIQEFKKRERIEV
jgi:hypothetical protein